MTAGTYSSGTEGGPFFARKTWSGTNGKYSGSKLVWNPYSMSAATGNAVPGRYGGFDYYVGYAIGPGASVWTSNDTLALLSDLNARCRGHSFNLGVTTAEGKETIKMCIKTITKVTSAVRAIKHGRIDLALRSLGATPQKSHINRALKVRKWKPKPLTGRDSYVYDAAGQLTTKDVSGMWLEIQYGWRPLLQDVYEGMKAVEAIQNKPRQYFLKVQRSKRMPNWSSENYFQRSLIESVESRQIIAEVTEYSDITRSLGLTNPASISWELVPFSFVADWFIPIGTYLDALNTAPGLSGRYLLTSRVKSLGTIQGKNPPYVKAFSVSKTTNITRSVEAAFVVPTPVFNSVTSSITASRAKNAIALLHQVVS